MTLQQLRYIIAVYRERNFAKAAMRCGISQPTLSSLLAKLEEELDVRIFERSNKHVSPTTTGEKIIRQAQKALIEAERVSDLVAEEKEAVSGRLALSVSPTIAPYILPEFISRYMKNYPAVNLSIREMKAMNMFRELQEGELDAGIALCGFSTNGIIRGDGVSVNIIEIPLYTERFLVYISEQCLHKRAVFNPEDLEHEKMWIMKEAQCLRESAFSFCKSREKGKQIYEAGSIETLIRIVDKNGGFTIIPEMHLPFLTKRQKVNVRKIEGDYLSQRRVSIYIREDYIRQHMLNTITDTLKSFIPKRMMDKRVLKYGIKL